jgi:hypothetical protein
MVDQDFVQRVSQVWHAQFVTELRVNVVTTKKVLLLVDSFVNCYPVINLLLRTAFYPKVAKLQWVYVSLEKLKSICALIHEINFSDNSDGHLSFRVYLPCHLECVRVSQVRVSSGQS